MVLMLARTALVRSNRLSSGGGGGAVPTFVAVGAVGTVDAAEYAGAAANDIGVIIVSADSSPTISDIANWTAFSATVTSGANGTRAFWRRMPGAVGTVSVSISGASQSGVIMFGIRGCITTGNPFEDYQSQVGTSTSQTSDSITTTGTNRLAIRVGGTQAFIADMGSPPSGYTQAFEDNFEPCFSMDYKSVPTATTEAASTRTLGTSTNWFTHTFAMIPA